jgi:hypothetical protein
MLVCKRELGQQEGRMCTMTGTGKKDKGGREEKKKPKLNPKEKRKLKNEKKQKEKTIPG